MVAGLNNTKTHRARVVPTPTPRGAYTIDMMYRSMALLGGAIQLAVALPALLDAADA